MEALDRGVVAVPAIDGGVLVSWRLLGDDPAKIVFNLYRDGTKLNAGPLAGPTDFVDKTGASTATYTVRAVSAARKVPPASPPRSGPTGYLSLPIQPPADGVTPSGEAYAYTANDASVGDLDGDGRYEIVLKWDPTNYQGQRLRRLYRTGLYRRLYAGGPAPVAHRPGPQHPGRRPLHPVPGL
jgi:rhamnogalacturonan endolyase